MEPRLAPLNQTEVAQIATDLQVLVGAQLQECLQTPSEFGISFYHEGETVWLWFDLSPLRPLVVRQRGKPPARKKIQRPLSLFLKSRFLGRRLSAVRADIARGRILIFAFHRGQHESAEEVCEIEVRLFPHGQNVIARDGASSIAENKPKELPPPQGESSAHEGRSWSDIETQWFEIQSGRVRGVAASREDAAAVEREWLRAIAKKEKALERMNEDLLGKSTDLHSRAGDWLKANPPIDLPNVPVDFRDVIDLDKSHSWNIQNCFQRAKDNIRKAEGTRARLEQVQAELLDLRERGPGAFSRRREQSDASKSNNLLSRSEARGRRQKLAEDLDVYIGKSAADNLALLRRAQPFDYWLHLREQPGSHAILRRTRHRIVTDREFADAGRWVVEQSLSKRASELKGERFDLLIVECRYVRPIKGDKLGRVNYTNDRVLTLRF